MDSIKLIAKLRIDQYFDLKQQLFDYFGYVEDWRVFAVDDARGHYWKLVCDNTGVHFADTIADLHDEEGGNYYANEIYKQRFLSKWIYRTEEYTMMLVDTHTDGNKYLQIFDNAKELTENDND